MDPREEKRLAAMPMEKRLAAIKAMPSAKDRLEASHALLQDAEAFQRDVSAARAGAAVTLVEDGDAADGRIYSQLEISRLLGMSPSLGQHLVKLGRQFREYGGPQPVQRPSRTERAQRRQEELEEVAKRLADAGVIEVREG